MNQDLTKPYQYDPSLSMRDNQEAAEQHALERRVALRDAKRPASDPGYDRDLFGSSPQFLSRP